MLTGFVGNADSTTLKDIPEHVKPARQGSGNLHVCLCVCYWRDALWEILGRHKPSFGFPPISSWEQLKVKGGELSSIQRAKEVRASLWALWYFHLAFPVCVHFPPLPVPLSRMEHFGGSVPAGTMFIWAPRFLNQAEARSKRTYGFPLSHYPSVNITTQKLSDPCSAAGCSLGL